MMCTILSPTGTDTEESIHPTDSCVIRHAQDRQQNPVLLQMDIQLHSELLAPTLLLIYRTLVSVTNTSLWKVCVLSSSDSGAIQRAGSLPCRQQHTHTQQSPTLSEEKMGGRKNKEVCVRERAYRCNFTIVVFVREVSGETKVSNLESKVFRNEDIASSQVPVDTLQKEVRDSSRALVGRKTHHTIQTQQ